MADEPAPYQPSATDDAIIDEINRASPSGGDSVPVSTATRHASDAQSRDNPVTQAIVGATNDSSTAADQPPKGYLNQAFDTILGLPKQVGTWLTTPVNPDLHAEAGLVRGVRDVLDTGAHGLASAAAAVLPDGWGPDVDAMRANDKAERDAWEAQHGNSTAAGIARLGGQYLATAGPIGIAGRAVAAGAGMIGPTVQAAARFLTGAAPAENFLPRTAQLALTGAGTGASQAALTSGGYDQSTGEQIGTGAATGAVLGPVIGGATKLLDASRGYAGFDVRPEVADLADTARGYGVTPPVTSLTTNPFLRQVFDALQKLPFSGADAGALAKQRQFQSGLTGYMGSTADTLGPAVMKETADRLSGRYNRLYASAPPITGGAPLINDIANVGTDAAQFLVGDQAGAMAHVGNAIQKVTDAFHGGSLDPQAYKSLMGANDGTLARIEDAAPSAAQPYLQKIRDAVQDRFAASAGPDAAAELRDLDRQWRVMKTVQPLAAVSTLGDISPGGLMQKVINASNQFDGSTSGVAYTGGGPLGDLGRIGKQFFGHIPDSGTAGRLQAYDMAKNPWSTLGMIPFGIGLGRPAQMWANSPRIAGRVIDTALGQPIPDITRAMPAGLLGALNYERSP